MRLTKVVLLNLKLFLQWESAKVWGWGQNESHHQLNMIYINEKLYKKYKKLTRTCTPQI